MAKPNYDTSIARMAGNIAAGLVQMFHLRAKSLDDTPTHDWIVLRSVSLARAIVAEIQRTETVERPRRANLAAGESWCGHSGPWTCEREGGHSGKHMAWDDYDNRVLYDGGEWE